MTADNIYRQIKFCYAVLRKKLEYDDNKNWTKSHIKKVTK